MSIMYDPGPVPLARPSAAVVVYRYTPDATDPSEFFELLPHVRCLGIQKRDGAEPWAARFRYTFQDAALSPGDPYRVEHVYGYDAAGDPDVPAGKVVLTDDRLVVRAYRDDGYSEGLFDGYVQPVQADLSRATEGVSFVALGTPVREWDTPVAGAVYRNAKDPINPDDVVTDLPVRFNPDGRPNATPIDKATGSGDSGTAPAQYPVFLGPVWPADAINGQTLRKWTLGMAVRYLIGTGNKDQTYVTYDDLTWVDRRLHALVSSTQDDGVIDTADTTTYKEIDVDVEDYTADGMSWPEAVQRLIEPHGFTLRFLLNFGEADPAVGQGEPDWTFNIVRKDNPLLKRAINLQQAGPGVALDPGQTNVGELALARDVHDLANRIAVDAGRFRYEASFVLAPLFTVAAGDAAAATATNADGKLTAPWVSDNLPTGVNVDKYRLYGFDECGEAHWDFTGNDTVAGVPGDLGPVLNPDAKSPPPFTVRRRPGLASLVTSDDKKRPLKARLDVSFDYKGAEPAVYDSSDTTSHWYQLTDGWALADDRLGIVITTADPNSLHLKGAPGDKLNLVEWTAAPTAETPRPHFRLTCSIEGDQDFNVIAGRRVASPTRFKVTRRVDGRDRFRRSIVSTWSAYNPDPEGGPFVLTDDEQDAQDHADARRRASEAGVFSGTVTIPRLSTAYDIGDFVTGVSGRGVSFRQNLGAGAGESPVYPMVAAVNWDFDGKQVTTLELTDRRTAPLPKRSRDREENA